MKASPATLEYQTPQPEVEGPSIQFFKKPLGWPLLIVIVITMLAWVVIKQSFHSRSGLNPRIAVAKTDLPAIAGALEHFQTDMGRLPSTTEGFAALTCDDEAAPNAHRYLKRLPIDPWRHEYRYQRHPDGINFTISSDGPDGIPGTHDDIVLDSGAP